ncbi:MAG: sugar phosphate isomerase/epimerase family protein [Planctomycetota bacterium]
MKRREAIQAVAAMGTIGVLGSHAAGADDSAASTPWIRKTLKIGMINVKGTLAEKFAAAKEAGFEGVEVNVPGINAEEVRTAAEEAGIIVDGSVINSHWNIRHTDPAAAVRSKALDDLKRGLEETAAAGGHSALLVAGHGKDGEADVVLKRSIENIKLALPTAEKTKVPILIENVWNHFLYDHGGGQDQSAQPLADFIDAFDSPWVGVQFDLGNHWKYGDIAEWIRTLGPRIKKLDIKGFSRKTNRFTKITEGDVDWAGIEAALREVGFKGWCAAEVGGGDLNRLKEIASNMEAALHCTVNA